MRAITLLLALLTASVAWSQQQPGFTQFLWDQLSINPGAAGHQDGFTVRSFYRMQWLGVEGAPQTQTLSVHGRAFGDAAGMGLTVYHDQHGITRELVARASGAYRMSLQKGVLSLGLSAQYGFHQHQWNTTAALETDDPSIPLSMSAVTSMNAGFGVHYQSQTGYFSVSVPTILEDEFEQGFTAERHFYAAGAQRFRLSRTFEIQPSAMLRYLANAPVQIDGQIAAIFNQTFYAAVGYRHGDSIALMLQYALTENWTFGYGFDLTTTALWINSGTHEVFLGYNLNRRKQGYQHPRFY